MSWSAKRDADNAERRTHDMTAMRRQDQVERDPSDIPGVTQTELDEIHRILSQ